MNANYNCKNTNCYITDELLSNETFEHIIPNSLGGFLKSNKLVLSRINTGMFDKLDSELAEKIEISKIINFKRERGTQPPIKVKSDDGFDYLLDKNLKATPLSIRPLIIESNDGKRQLKYPLQQKESLYKSQLKKKPLLTREEFENQTVEIETSELTKFFFKYGLSFIEDSYDSFRAIAKIATNFAVLNNFGKGFFLNFIDFIKGQNNLDKIQIGYFYPNNLMNYDFEENEVSHILHLKACKKERLLYCYIELFNTHCFIVNLSYNYLGEDFCESHVWDTINGKLLKKSISLNVTKDYLMSRGYFYYPEVEKDYLNRLRRLGDILKLNLTEYKVQK